MTFQKKADAVNIGSKRFGTYQSNKTLFGFNSNRTSDFGQCIQCRSDYMKFAEKGVCQDCQQKVEFITREHPRLVSKIQTRKMRDK